MTSLTGIEAFGNNLAALGNLAEGDNFDADGIKEFAQNLAIQGQRLVSALIDDGELDEKENSGLLDDSEEVASLGSESSDEINTALEESDLTKEEREDLGSSDFLPGDSPWWSNSSSSSSSEDDENDDDTANSGKWWGSKWWDA